MLNENNNIIIIIIIYIYDTNELSLLEICNIHFYFFKVLKYLNILK